MARIQTLGLPTGPVARIAGAAGVPAAAGSKAPEPSMVEMGTTGTGIFGRGYVRELGEYNALFSGGPFSAYRTYEQMRRGDAQVAGVLVAQKSPVRGAEWKVQPPKDATPVEQEAAEFVETCLFDDVDFDRTLENLLLALDFGSACHEDVWTITNGQVRPAKLAARMPLTFYNWQVDGQENLTSLVQHGFHGGGFGEYVLPADKIALYAFRMEGANFAGRSILREMYGAWFTKNLLYKIDAIGCERNSMGVPVGKLGPGATKEDRKMFEQFLKTIAAHQNSYVMAPDGYDFELKGVTGQLRNCWESIEHHNTQITMAALLAFMVMGHGAKSSGNRSLGETMSDFFFMALQSLANQVADAYSDNTIARLVLYNYGPKVRPPRLEPQKINALKFEAVTEALSKLATAKVVTPDPDMEVWLRRQLGAPDVDRAEIERLREKTITTGAPEPGGPPGVGAEKAKEEEKAKEKTALSQVAGVRTRREARGVEKCLALSEIVGALDKGRDDVAAALRAARPRVQAEILHRVMSRPVGSMHRASVEADATLQAEVETILRGVAEFGVTQVAGERARQLGGAAPADAAAIRMADAKPDDAIGLYADAVVSEYTNILTSRATNAAIDAKRKGGTLGATIEAARAALDDQSDKWIDGVASKGANEAFAEGRAEGFGDYRDEIARYVYSALLDLNTCEACAGADGSEAENEDDIPDVPNPDCDGGDRCRCVHVAVFQEKEVAA